MGRGSASQACIPPEVLYSPFFFLAGISLVFAICQGGRTRMEAVEAVGARVCRRNHYAYQKRRSMSQMRDGKNGRFASSTSYQNIVGSRLRPTYAMREKPPDICPSVLDSSVSPRKRRRIMLAATLRSLATKPKRVQVPGDVTTSKDRMSCHPETLRRTRPPTTSTSVSNVITDTKDRSNTGLRGGSDSLQSTDSFRSNTSATTPTGQAGTSYHNPDLDSEGELLDEFARLPPIVDLEMNSTKGREPRLGGKGYNQV
ncbi:hypothetical protein AAMO2058_001217300 [Amorphochlora amoebiformis]